MKSPSLKKRRNASSEILDSVSGDFHAQAADVLARAFRGSYRARFLHGCQRKTLEPIVYTVKVSKPGKHVAEVEIVLPTEGRPSIELMMPVWSPGFYRVQDYAKQVEELRARSTDGAARKVEQSQKNHWRIETGGEPRIVVSYRLICKQVSVTTNYIDDDLAVLNGAATFPLWWKSPTSS